MGGSGQQEGQEPGEILREIFDHIPAMISLIHESNGESWLLAVNREWERVFGWSEQEVVGRQDLCAEMFADPNEVERSRKFSQEADGTWTEMSMKVPRGVIHTVWTNRRLSDGRVIALGQDITHQKKAEEALVEAREQLEKLVERDSGQGNHYGLSVRELTVLQLVAAGKRDAEIARLLGISQRTAQAHLAKILSKMKASTRTEAGVRAVREGLIN